MRFCLPIWEFHDRGGIEKSVTELVRWFLAGGHDVEIIASRNQSALAHPRLKIREMRLPRLPVSSRPLRSLVEVPAFVLASTALIRARSSRWDCVINYGVGQTMAPGLLVATSCHLAWMKERRRVLGKGLGSPLNAFILGVERFNYRTARGQPMVAVSRQVASQLAELYGVDKSRIHIAYPGVDVDAFAPADRAALRQRLSERHGVPPEDLWFVFCGYEYHRKGLDVLLRAAASAAGTKLRVVVVGDDPVARPGMENLARELGIGERVYFVGSHEQVAPWFQASDVFVLPTRMDAFGMVVLEAMACGIPVITSGAAGVSELIRPGENGYVLSRPDAVEELTTILGRLAGSVELRARVGRAARRTATEHTWEAHAQRILDVITQHRSCSARP